MPGGNIKTTFSRVLYEPIQNAHNNSRSIISIDLLNKISGNSKQMKRIGNIPITSNNTVSTSTTIYVNDDIMRPVSYYDERFVSKGYVSGVSIDYYYWLFKRPLDPSGPFQFDILKAMDNVSILIVGGGGGGGNSSLGYSNGGGGGGQTLFVFGSGDFSPGDFAKFTVGSGGEPHSDGMPSTADFMYNGDIFCRFKAGQGYGGNDTAGGEGGIIHEYEGVSSRSVAIPQNGGNGGDMSNGASGTMNSFTFIDTELTGTIPPTLTSLLVANGISGNSWGGGGGGAKYNGDNYNWTGGYGATRGQGGSRGIIDQLPTNGTDGSSGGGGGAAGWDAINMEYFSPGKGGDGFIFLWVPTHRIS